MSNKKLRNVRFEVPQMSEEMGGPVLFQTLEDAQEAAEQFGAYAIWKVKGSVFAPSRLGTFGRTNRGSGSKSPRTSSVSAVQRECTRRIEHATQGCISAPFPPARLSGYRGEALM